MDITRTMQKKRRAVRKLVESFPKEEEKPALQGNFKFPPPPDLVDIPCKGSTDTSDTCSDQSSVQEENVRIPCMKRNFQHGYRSDGSPPHRLSPIGVFWDIENCQIPHGKSAILVVQAVREKFFKGFREAEFIVVCDVKKESPQIIQELNDAQVNLIHVPSTSKNAADEKLRQSMRRFADIHGFPAAIVLISGDINFASDLSDLRHRKKLHIILLHNSACSIALILCANEHYNFDQFVMPLPSRVMAKQNWKIGPMEVMIWNLPKSCSVGKLRERLKYMSSNCGGRISFIVESVAVVRFPSFELATRAHKRMNGEIMYGNQIGVSYPQRAGTLKKETTLSSKAQNGSYYYSNGRSNSQSDLNGTNAMYGSEGSNHVNYFRSTSLQETSVNSVATAPPEYPSLWDASNNGVDTSASGNNFSVHTKNYDEFQMSSETAQYNQNCYPNLNGEIPFPNQGNGYDDMKQTDSSRNRDSETMWNCSKNTGVMKKSRTPSPYTQSNSNTQKKTIPENMESESLAGKSVSATSFSVRTVTYDEFQSNCKTLHYSKNCHSKDNGEPSFQNNGVESSMKQKEPSMNRDSETHRSNSKNAAAKKSRTPSPFLVKPKTMSVTSNSQRKSFQENVDSEKYFNPIQTPYSAGAIASPPVELHITNLDHSIEPMEMKKILLQIFGEHVMVLHVSVFMQSDSTFAASIKVPSIQDAQYAISQLHRRKIGFKRIMISYSHSTQPHNPQFVRWQVVSLLLDVPDSKLPLFKFLKLFESRYVTTISLSDLYKLKDVCCITDESTGRMVSLNPDLRNSPSPNFSSQDVEPYCSKHYRKSSFKKGWAEREVPPLPNMNISLKEFSSATIRLIATHNNALPLSSFADCYEAECGELPTSENGVPLEHFVTWVDKVELAIANGVKYLRPAPPRNFMDDRVEDFSKCVSPPLVNQLTLFGRELVDLLRTQHHCQLIFNRLIPAYHHHFGKQCRVANYGFTKLIDLLDAIPNIAQVIGEGNKRVVTLSQRAQVRRFTTDLLRALKSQPSKKITFEELPQIFERVTGKPFDPADYGLCTLSDLIDHVPESTVVVNRGQITTLSISKREQTQDEVERTRQFAKEVVELLGHAPHCSILFHQFIPAYHHHYGHQCRVADFGFAKLIELFEAIPDIVKLDEDSKGERRVTLTHQQKLLVTGEMICDIVIPTYTPGLPLDNLASTFLWQYGYALTPQTYGFNTLEELIDSLDTVRLENSEYGGVVVPVKKALVKQLMTQVRKYLLLSEDGKMKLSKLVSYFSSFHASHLTPSSLAENLPDAVCIKTVGGEKEIHLTDLYQVGRQLVQILNANYGHMSLSALEAAYSRERGDMAGHSSLASVLTSLSSVATVKGKSFKRHVILNKDLVTKKEANLEKAICRPSSTSSLPSQLERLEDSPIQNWFPQSVPVVNLPDMETLPENLLELATSMISPCKGLLPPSARPPHPSLLPIPVGLTPNLRKNRMSEKDGSSEENKGSDCTSTATAKRKSRLAAHFETPLDFSWN